MPTSTHEDDECVYEEVEEVLKGFKGADNLILMGDWNAVVREGKEGNIVRKYGLDKRSGREDRLVDSDHNLVIIKCSLKCKRIILYLEGRLEYDPSISGRLRGRSLIQMAL